MIATEYVARSDPDGYTLLLASPGAIMVNPVVMAKINYSPTKDFAPISMIASFPLMMVVDPKLPIYTVADVVNDAKAHLKDFTAGGSGFAARLVHEMFKQRTDIPLEFVVYRSSGDAALAVIGGQLFMSNHRQPRCRRPNPFQPCSRYRWDDTKARRELSQPTDNGGGRHY